MTMKTIKVFFLQFCVKLNGVIDFNRIKSKDEGKNAYNNIYINYLVAKILNNEGDFFTSE